MAVIKRGILGGFSNKIGNIVGTSWKGIAVMKTLPLSVANPRTTAQVNQRDRFGTIATLGSILLSTIVKPLWDRFAQQASGFNDFLRENVNGFFLGSYGSPDTVVMSKGKMVAVNPLTAALNDTTNALVVTWPTTLPDAYADASDKAYILVMNLATEGAKGYATTATRGDGTVTLSYTLPGDITDPFVFLAFARADGTVVSNTGFLELTVT